MKIRALLISALLMVGIQTTLEAASRVSWNDLYTQTENMIAAGDSDGAGTAIAQLQKDAARLGGQTYLKRLNRLKNSLALQKAIDEGDIAKAERIMRTSSTARGQVDIIPAVQEALQAAKEGRSPEDVTLPAPTPPTTRPVGPGRVTRPVDLKPSEERIQEPSPSPVPSVVASEEVVTEDLVLNELQDTFANLMIAFGSVYQTLVDERERVIQPVSKDSLDELEGILQQLKNAHDLVRRRVNTILAKQPNAKWVQGILEEQQTVIADKEKKVQAIREKAGEPVSAPAVPIPAKEEPTVLGSDLLIKENIQQRLNLLSEKVAAINNQFERMAQTSDREMQRTLLANIASGIEEAQREMQEIVAFQLSMTSTRAKKAINPQIMAVKADIETANNRFIEARKTFLAAEGEAAPARGITTSSEPQEQPSKPVRRPTVDIIGDLRESIESLNATLANINSKLGAIQRASDKEQQRALLQEALALHNSAGELMVDIQKQFGQIERPSGEISSKIRFARSDFDKATMRIAQAQQKLNESGAPAQEEPVVFTVTVPGIMQELNNAHKAVKKYFAEYQALLEQYHATNASISGKNLQELRTIYDNAGDESLAAIDNWKPFMALVQRGDRQALHVKDAAEGLYNQLTQMLQTMETSQKQLEQQAATQPAEGGEEPVILTVTFPTIIQKLHDAYTAVEKYWQQHEELFNQYKKDKEAGAAISSDNLQKLDDIYTNAWAIAYPAIDRSWPLFIDLVRKNDPQALAAKSDADLVYNNLLARLEQMQINERQLQRPALSKSDSIVYLLEIVRRTAEYLLPTIMNKLSVAEAQGSYTVASLKKAESRCSYFTKDANDCIKEALDIQHTIRIKSSAEYVEAERLIAQMNKNLQSIRQQCKQITEKINQLRIKLGVPTLEQEIGAVEGIAIQAPEERYALEPSVEEVLAPQVAALKNALGKEKMNKRLQAMLDGSFVYLMRNNEKSKAQFLLDVMVQPTSEKKINLLSGIIRAYQSDTPVTAHQHVSEALTHIQAREQGLLSFNWLKSLWNNPYDAWVKTAVLSAKEADAIDVITNPVYLQPFAINRGQNNVYDYEFGQERKPQYQQGLNRFVDDIVYSQIFALLRKAIKLDQLDKRLVTGQQDLFLKTYIKRLNEVIDEFKLIAATEKSREWLRVLDFHTQRLGELERYAIAADCAYAQVYPFTINDAKMGLDRVYEAVREALHEKTDLWKPQKSIPGMITLHGETGAKVRAAILDKLNIDEPKIDKAEAEKKQMIAYAQMLVDELLWQTIVQNKKPVFDEIMKEFAKESKDQEPFIANLMKFGCIKNFNELMSIYQTGVSASPGIVQRLLRTQSGSLNKIITEATIKPYLNIHDMIKSRLNKECINSLNQPTAGNLRALQMGLQRQIERIVENYNDFIYLLDPATTAEFNKAAAEGLNVELLKKFDTLSQAEITQQMQATLRLKEIVDSVNIYCRRMRYLTDRLSKLVAIDKKITIDSVSTILRNNPRATDNTYILKMATSLIITKLKQAHDERQVYEEVVGMLAGPILGEIGQAVAEALGPQVATVEQALSAKLGAIAKDIVNSVEGYLGEHVAVAAAFADPSLQRLSQETLAKQFEVFDAEQALVAEGQARLGEEIAEMQEGVQAEFPAQQEIEAGIREEAQRLEREGAAWFVKESGLEEQRGAHVMSERERLATEARTQEEAIQHHLQERAQAQEAQRAQIVERYEQQEAVRGVGRALGGAARQVQGVGEFGSAVGEVAAQQDAMAGAGRALGGAARQVQGIGEFGSAVGEVAAQQQAMEQAETAAEGGAEARRLVAQQPEQAAEPLQPEPEAGAVDQGPEAPQDPMKAEARRVESEGIAEERAIANNKEFMEFLSKDFPSLNPGQLEQLLSLHNKPGSDSRLTAKDFMVSGVDPNFNQVNAAIAEYAERLRADPETIISDFRQKMGNEYIAKVRHAYTQKVKDSSDSLSTADLQGIRDDALSYIGRLEEAAIPNLRAGRGF